MSENKTNERKKLSLSGSGKLTLKKNVNSRLPGSITTNSRSGRNTVQVEVKRTKRSNEKSNSQFLKTSENRNSLSAEQISQRSKELKESLTRTAKQAENNGINEFDNKSLEKKKI